MRGVERLGKLARRADEKVSAMQSEKPVPKKSRIIDVTEEALKAGITGFQIIGGVPPESWLREHGYIKDKK